MLDDLKRKSIKWRLITVGNNCHHWTRGQRKEVGMPEPRSLEEGLRRAGSYTSKEGATDSMLLIALRVSQG